MGKRHFGSIVIFGLLTVSTLIAAGDSKPETQATKVHSLQINHIDLIPMTEETVLRDKTVIVQDGTIMALTDQPPANSQEAATIIDGTGCYLIPGLVDMHAHVNSKKDLDLYVANGVTTVQNMWGIQGFLELLGFCDQLKLREQIKQGKLRSPYIFTAGPILEGAPSNHPFMMALTNREKAKELVKDQVGQGYDFIKVYDHLSPDVYQAICEEAGKLSIPVKGHVPSQVGLEKALQSGQIQIDHLTGFLDYDGVELLVPESRLREYARMASDNRVAVCPTIVFTQKRVKMDQFDEMAKLPAMKHLNFMQRIFLRQSVKALEKDLKYQGMNYQEAAFALYHKVIQALQAENVMIMAGTDSGNPFVFAGYSLHEELALFVRAGLSPFEALAAATVNPYACLRRLDEGGTIEVGKRADLVILRQNPLLDINYTKEIEGVILRGEYFNREALNRMLRKGF